MTPSPTYSCYLYLWRFTEKCDNCIKLCKILEIPKGFLITLTPNCLRIPFADFTKVSLLEMCFNVTLAQH